ncbi:ComF family protein [Kytococcus sedentarius]|uniref:ComF family protein n=1 Tax=Kytococcus sedentarius TaxID=1276 RepID=UPI0035BC11DD
MSVWAAVGDLALPRACAGCGEPAVRWCTACLEGLVGELGSGLVCGRLGGLPVWAAGDYAGRLRAAVAAYKDGERRDLRPLLSRVLLPALGRALAAPEVAGSVEGGPASERPGWPAPGRVPRVAVVPAPSRGPTLRSRGDDPVADLARAAVARWHQEQPGVLDARGGADVGVVRALRTVGRVQDQSRLTRAGRRRNLSGHVAVRRGAFASERPGAVVLVDDVITTGATIMACRDALRREGLPLVAVVACARVP